ncbi:RraA family protein [Amycolatopsis sp. FDAARGOS 1241]|uniref:RraA family protein n=1 Tax=Amycolatopsis sp. FDAARGOS 1241 TaxID=2778070 RepID=UPI001951910D|nr:methyltransferase [Amycolatopsis sp. FDAARGOS 1241]QRP47902.1 methyltransferase [Amycolatopsis sp. FDAARGOS 1241]
MTPDLEQRLRRLPTANIGDAMDRLYLMRSAIKPVWPGAKLVAPAYTVLTAAGDNKEIHAALENASTGEVIVVAGGGYPDRALIGELMAGRAKAAGLAGFVIDGAVRDAADIGELGVPVFATAVTPAGPYRNGPGLSQVPIAAGGVVVQPGDIIVGDDDGVAVLPLERVAEILERAEQKFEAETRQRAQIGQAVAR